MDVNIVLMYRRDMYRIPILVFLRIICCAIYRGTEVDGRHVSFLLVPGYVATMLPSRTQTSVGRRPNIAAF